MGQVTVFCVETFWRNKGRMEKAQLRQFGCEAEAQAVGKALGDRAPGVMVYRVTGSPRMDLWEEPVVLNTFGDVPAIDPDPPPDDFAYFKIDCSADGDTWTQVDPLAEREEEAGEEAA